MTGRFTALLFLACIVLPAADFQDYQASRAVIGQASFSGRDKGVSGRALSLAKGNLYVADASGHLLTFDLSRLGNSKSVGCAVCVVAPQATAAQSVFEGVAAFATNGRTIAIADAKNHRVIIKRGIPPQTQADVVLSNFGNPVSVALDGQRLFVGDAGTHHVYVWNVVPASDSQPDVTLGIVEGSEGPGADTIQTPSALASDGANLFVADSGAHRVLVFSTADSAAPQVENAATLSTGPVAPGTLLLINHAASARVTVLLNGTALAVAQTNRDQVQVQLPYDVIGAAATIWIKNELDDGVISNSRPAALRIATASPGIFAFGTKEPRTGLLLHAPEGIPLSPEDPAQPSELLSVWATGLGAVTSEANAEGAFDTLIPVRAFINGNAVDVISASLAADATGVYEVRLRMPAQVPPGATLTLMQNDSKSNSVTFPVGSNRN